MSIKRKLFLAAVTGTTLFISSCKKYLDINKNPNIVQTATVNTLLPSGEMYIASPMGVDMEVDGSIWAEYWTQNPNSSQYRQFEEYQPTSTDFEYPWTNLYDGGENLLQMYELAQSQNKKQYEAISLILRAYMFQVITDAWGDVPFSEALKGQPKDGGIVSPHYDMQKAIYQGILSYLDQANALINPADAVLPGTDDLIYQGDMTKWQKFSNTLRLRILLRMSEKDPATAQAGIAALYATSPAFIGEGDDAQINFSSTAGNKNPLYAEETGLSGTQNLVGSKTCIDSMNADDDYRGFIFYEYVPSVGAPVGIAQGNFSAVVTPGSYSIPSPYVAGDALNPASALAPVKFITSYESYFLQAEAVARGWGNAGVNGNDSSLFYQGIHASFYAYSAAFNDENLQLSATVFLTADYAYYSYLNGDTLAGLPPAYWGQYPSTGTVTQKIRHIITQKWFSMCGNEGFEAWTEHRRTGYPDFFVISKNSLIGNQLPKRFIYPNSEITRNLNFPGLQPVTSKVWWDVY